MLSPDPLAHVRDLVAKGKIAQALKYSTAASESLTQTTAELDKMRLHLHAIVFKRLAQAGEFSQTREHYDLIHALAKAEAIADSRIEDRYYRASLAIATAPTPVKRKYRHVALVEALRDVLDLTGEVVECGCFRGLSSWMICATIDEEGGGFDGSGYHIFDSFEGLSEPAKEDELTADVPNAEHLAPMMRPGTFACAEDQVRRNLSAYPGIQYHPGWLPQSLVGEPERRYRFLHIDVDLYAPTKGVLEYFYPRLVPGGIMLTDDYGWPGARQAFDEFCGPRNLEIESLATNQAILRKPR